MSISLTNSKNYFTLSPLRKEAQSVVVPKTGNPFASLESGHVPLDTEIILTPNNEDDIIYYTTDGTDPTDLSNLYDGSPLLIQEDTTLKLIAMRNDYKNSDIVTYEYLRDGPKQLSLGTDHSCVVLESGKINCWGNNAKWQLGDGSQDDRKSPVLVSGITTASEVSAGFIHSCALLETGEVMCWGANDFGQLGKEIGYSEIPILFSDFENITKIAVGGLSSCAIDSDNNLYCWGRNDFGQLGTGDTQNLFVPTKILENIADVDIGINHTCAIDLGNQLYCWGENQFGQLGDDTQDSSTLPVSIGSDFKNVKVGENHTCAIKLNNDLYCWGENQYGQLGTGTTELFIPVPTLMSTNIILMDLGNNHSCLIQENSEKDIIQACWGKNDFSQLTLPKDNDPHYTLEALKNIVNIHSTALGGNHSCSLINNNKNNLKEIYCWGDNQYGQVGVGAEDAVIETESNVTQIMYSEKK